MGSFSIENYLKAMFIFYPLYFFILMLVGYKILQNRGYLAILGVLAIAGMMALDFEKILRAPGLSPLRHFFDLACIGFLVWYWRSNNKLGLLFGYLFCIVQIAFNREFGIILFAALVGTQIILTLESGFRQKTFEIACAMSAIIITALLIFGLRGVSNSMNSYYWNGFASPPLPTFVFTGSLGLLALGYALCLIPLDLDRTVRQSLLFLLMYSNGLFLYYVWGASPAHFQNLAPIYALTGVVGIKAIFSLPSIKAWQRPATLAILLIFSFIFLLPSAVECAKTKRDFEDIFKSHVVHSWNFSHAHLQTTMDPEPFAQAINLIQKYEANTPAIYMLSVLDNIIPLLADRYSAMPFFDLSYFLLTHKEFAEAKATLQAAKPAHLFVDHTLLADHAGEIGDLNGAYGGGMRSESLSRVRRLETLAQLFRQVSSNYVKIAESPLIDVYERRPTSAP